MVDLFLTSKYGHTFDINDRLPNNSKQKETRYFDTRIRTRLTPKNRAQFRKNIRQFAPNKSFEPF
jgi:hypothetical protein